MDDDLDVEQVEESAQVGWSFKLSLSGRFGERLYALPEPKRPLVGPVRVG